MKSLAFSVCILFVIGATESTKICLSSSDVNTFWEYYKEKFGKKYVQPEDEMRKDIWEQNIADKIQHNLLADLGRRRFRKGMNEYSDLRLNEYKKNLLGYVKPKNKTRRGIPFKRPNKFKVPLTVGVSVDNGNNYLYPIVPARKLERRNKAGVQPLGATPSSPTQSSKGQIPLTSSSNNSFYYDTSYLDYLPDYIDWRDYGLVTAVKNQGQCGSCWSFSSTGSLEGQLAISTGVLPDLSEQYLVDCVTENLGCDGGWMDSAFEYMIHNGIEQEYDYPYTATQGPCNADPSNTYSYDEGYYSIPYGDETLLKAAVATQGPVSIAIDASQPSFQTYSYGIYQDPDCDTEDVNHAVLIVGYGTEGGTDYWLVKNSWGTSWGDQGYFKLARNSNNTCGVATVASFPKVP